jgi:hypothetical protein
MKLINTILDYYNKKIFFRKARKELKKSSLLAFGKWTLNKGNVFNHKISEFLDLHTKCSKKLKSSTIFAKQGDVVIIWSTVANYYRYKLDKNIAILELERLLKNKYTNSDFEYLIPSNPFAYRIGLIREVYFSRFYKQKFYVIDIGDKIVLSFQEGIFIVL